MDDLGARGVRKVKPTVFITLRAMEQALTRDLVLVSPG